MTASGGVVGEFASVKVHGTRKDKDSHCYHYKAKSQSNYVRLLDALSFACETHC